MIKISEFKSCAECPPTEEGEYLVIKFHRGKLVYASNLNYIPKYGWNVSRDCCTEEINTGSAISFTERKDYLWATAIDASYVKDEDAFDEDDFDEDYND